MSNIFKHFLPVIEVVAFFVAVSSSSSLSNSSLFDPFILALAIMIRVMFDAKVFAAQHKHLHNSMCTMDNLEDSW